MKRLVFLMSLLAMLLATRPAEATHFRGAAMVPEIDANGFLTVTTTSFWRKGFVGNAFVTVPGVAMSLQSTVVDQSDARYARRTSVSRSNAALPAAGTYTVDWGGCCRVNENNNGGNWDEDDWQMDSAIVWDGSGAAKPIDFNFGSVQPEVSRLGAYSQNLNATSPDGLSLSYNQNLSLNINSQPEGLVINTSTGQMTIPAGAGGTADYADHQQAINAGADRAFSGNIIASDGSFVEFDWMFDGVDQAVNNAPTVADGMAMGNSGDMFNFTFTTSDPDPGDVVTLDALLFAILGPGAAIAPIYDSLTGMISWDSLGSAFGIYIFQARGFDLGLLSDVGSWTVELKDPNAGGNGGVIPEPTALIVWGSLIGLGLMRRRG